MKTDALDACVRIISYHVHMDETVIDELLNPEMDIVQKFDEPFKKEINMNLLEIGTTQGKKDVLKHYIYEFWELQLFFANNTFLIGPASGHKDNWNYTDSEGKKKKADRWESYVFCCDELFNFLFTDLQNCCIKYDFNIHELCDELDFRIDIFDSGLTIYQEELKNKRFSNGEIQSQKHLENDNPNQELNFGLGNNRGSKNIKVHFYEYIEGSKRELIAEAIKKKYRGQIGRQIRLMIEAMKRIDGEGKLLIPNRGLRPFCVIMTQYFGESTGTYNSINGYNCLGESEILKEKDDILKMVKTIDNQ